MKTLIDIKNEVAKDKYDCTFQQACTFMRIEDTEDFMNVVAKRYAKKCCEDLRERIVDKATTACDCDVWNCEGESVDKNSIMNVEIILP